MSHYIRARLPNGQAIDLSAGTNWRTICAVADAGFDIYGGYEASHYNEGGSGGGSTKEVGEPLARRAFIRALAAAATLRCVYGPRPLSSPTAEDGKQLVAQAIEAHRASPFAPVGVEIASPELVAEAASLVPELVQELLDESPGEDASRRSLDSIDLFFSFARQVYEASRLGLVEIIYS